MLYVSEKRCEQCGNEYAVTDTKDSTTECISEEQLKQLLVKGVDIFGVGLRGDELCVKVYPDSSSIVAAYNLRCNAIGKPPKCILEAGKYRGSIIWSSRLGLPDSGARGFKTAGGVRLPDFNEPRKEAGDVKIPDVVEELRRYEDIDAWSWRGYADTEYDSLVLSKRLRVIRRGALSCINVRSGLTLPSSIVHLEGYAFSMSTIFGDLRISDGITYIEEGAFYRCHIAGDLYLPSSLRTIEGNVFGDCVVYGRVLFSTSPKVYKEVDIGFNTWENFKCAGFGKGVQEFFKIDMEHGFNS